jgi:urease accessory protein
MKLNTLACFVLESLLLGVVMNTRIARTGLLSGAALVSALSPALALAHPGHGAQMGFVSGVMHPLTGVDHLTAMLALGMWASTLNKAARWAAPFGFVLMMLVGGVLGLSGAALPGIEVGIAASVCALGVLLLARVQATAVVAALLAGVFAVFHGYAHGAEAQDAHVASYLGGFALSTLALHLTGLWCADRMRASMLRMTGAAIALGGVVLLAL